MKNFVDTAGGFGYIAWKYGIVRNPRHAVTDGHDGSKPYPSGAGLEAGVETHIFERKSPGFISTLATEMEGA